MLRTALLSLVLIVSLSSSTSMLRKSVVRRQTDPQFCQAIEGFECKCSYYRVTCTTNHDLPSPIVVQPNEQDKYQSVELVISAARDINVNDQTFAPVKQLFKTDGDNFEFRVKFEKFTALHLSSPGIFNQVFPTNAPSNARKHLALEIYNPDVPPNDNSYLFQNLNADSVELYALYPFKGTFQQLFDGAHIKYLRLSGGDIRSDVSQPFSGNIGRLELAKQASALSVQNFPVYPAHELTINAFYVDDFNNEHPPNYNNLGELRVHSKGNIPANAFQNFPNIQTLQITTEQNIDPQALNGLNKLEKLIIKDTQPSLDLLKNLPNLKEFETNVDKLDEKTQCQLIEKLANGQLAVQAIPNGRECTCVSAYLDTAAGRTPCAAQHCDHSSCAAIKNNYNAADGTFKAPPAIQRADGTNALQPREQQVYTGPFQITYQDQEKLQKGTPQQAPPQQVDQQGSPDGQQYNPQDTAEGSDGDSDDTQINENPDLNDDASVSNNEQDQQGGQNQDGYDGTQTNEGGDSDSNTQTPALDENGFPVNGTAEATGPAKKGMSWLPIIIIAAAILALLLIGLIVLLVRKKRANTNKGYNQTATTEGAGAQGARA